MNRLHYCCHLPHIYSKQEAHHSSTGLYVLFTLKATDLYYTHTHTQRRADMQTHTHSHTHIHEFFPLHTLTHTSHNKFKFSRNTHRHTQSHTEVYRESVLCHFSHLFHPEIYDTVNRAPLKCPHRLPFRSPGPRTVKPLTNS